MKLTERRWLAAGAAGLLAIALVAAAVALLARGNSPQVPTRASQYTASTACLVTALNPELTGPLPLRLVC